MADDTTNASPTIASDRTKHRRVWRICSRRWALRYRSHTSGLIALSKRNPASDLSGRGVDVRTGSAAELGIALYRAVVCPLGLAAIFPISLRHCLEMLCRLSHRSQRLIFGAGAIILPCRSGLSRPPASCASRLRAGGGVGSVLRPRRSHEGLHQSRKPASHRLGASL